MNKSYRTDLAFELETPGNMRGISMEKSADEDVTVTRLIIENKEAQERIGKPMGKYITIEAPQLLYDTDVYTKVCRLLAECINEIAETERQVLVAGLGNRAVTPDALGPEVVSRVFVTNHIKQMTEYDFADKLGSVCAVAPGVLGTTGMKTAGILRGIVQEEKPQLVIAVDAYAAADIAHLSTTIQLSDTGLVPGGGVGNRQNAVNEETLGVPTIAIGVPTVVDAGAVMKEEMTGSLMSGMFVTPKEIDLVIDRAAKTIANGINMALHPKLSMKEIESYIG